MFFLVVFALSVIPQSSASASQWGSVEWNLWQTTLYKEMQIRIRAIITAAAQRAAEQILNTQIQAAISFGPGGVKFITNWQSYLATDPQKNAQAYMENAFRASTGGRATSMYIPSGGNAAVQKVYDKEHNVVVDKDGTATATAGGEISLEKRSWLVKEGIISTASAGTFENGSGSLNASQLPMMALGTGSYDQYLVSTGQQAIRGGTSAVDITCNPTQAFVGGDYRCFNSFFQGINNPMAYSLWAQDTYRGALAQEQMLAQTQAIAYQGFKASVGSDGVSVMTPGITIRDILSSGQKMGFENISNAQNVEQVITAGATAAVNTITNGLMNFAQSAVTQAVDQSLKLAEGMVNSGMNSGMSYLNGSVSNLSGNGLQMSVSGGSLAATPWNTAMSSPMNAYTSGLVTNLQGVTQGGLDAGTAAAMKTYQQQQLTNQSKSGALTSTNFGVNKDGN